MCQRSPVVPCESCPNTNCRNNESIKKGKLSKPETGPVQPDTEIVETDYCLEDMLDVRGLLEAYSLVYNRYVEAEYIPENTCGIRISGFELLPDSETFTVRNSAHFIVSTATLVCDNESGLPLDTVFPEEANSLRRKGRRLAEGTMFANNPIAGRVESAEANLILLSATLRKCAEEEIDTYLVVVNPKHALFWEQFVGFKRLSSDRACSHVKGNPGILFGIDVPNAMDPKSKIAKLIESVDKRFITRSCVNDKSLVISHLIRFLLKSDPRTILEIPKNLFRSIVTQFDDEECDLPHTGIHEAADNGEAATETELDRIGLNCGVS